jgi:CHRD domain
MDCTIFIEFQLFYYLAEAKNYCMRLLKLFYFTAFIAVAFTFNSCSDKVEVNVVRKTGIVMDGTQEVPAKPGAGNGTMDVEYNKDTRVLYYKVTWNSLSGAPILMHIHGIAAKGFSAPVIQTFSGFPGVVSGTYSGSVFFDGVVFKEENLYAGEYYINIHTALNPGGEIRGQIVF